MLEHKKQIVSTWFRELRDTICKAFEDIETEYSSHNALNESAKFIRTSWDREGGGGGEMSVMKGEVFEKVGVNISNVYGVFSEKFQQEIPGAIENPNFFAAGISIVAHMKSPLVPSIHMNTRFIATSKTWFGGGMDLTPTFEFEEDTEFFHGTIKNFCDKHDKAYYPKFKEECDKYFFLPHRNEMRGVGGVFYDYLNTENFDKDFSFTKDVGNGFLEAYLPLVRNHYFKDWTSEQKRQQLIKRGRYAEFNLLYDRGTRFGLMTGGNTNAILMSLPPEAIWE